MRLTWMLTMAALLLAALPDASAHDCNGWDCGPCARGEYHNHNSARGQCSSGPGWFAENGYGGQQASWGGSASAHARYSPGTATMGTVLALAAAVLLVGRRA